MKAIRFDTFGGPSVLSWRDHALPDLGPGDVRVRLQATGVNFIDVYHRTGLYPVPLPSGLGAEGAGLVEAVGSDVTDIAVGDRVAWGTGPLGAYAEVQIVPAHVLLKLPDSISFETGAAMMLKGMTARYLLRATHVVKPGDTLLFHAAAGGVGLIACQWASALGATVIGTVGSAEKAALAKAHGCAHVINMAEDNLVGRVKEITSGKGVDVVYDGVGQATAMASLDCLKPRGLFVSFGNASGPVRNFDLGWLAARGSLYVTRPTLWAYTSTPQALQETAQDLLDVVMRGIVRIPVFQRFALKDVALAHAALEARQTTGCTVLLP